ncbi:hypothetical protein MD484_g1668, partial [Candolleomyces efflorescens]
MATVRRMKDGNARISTSFTYNSVKEIQSLNLPALHRTHSAGAASVASTTPSASPSERAGRQAIPRDEPCFITKRPGYSLAKAYLVNPVRKDRKLKNAVESFLMYCHIVYTGFNLNSASNLIPLDQTLYYTLDKLGFFAITCSKATLLAMLDVVKEQNQICDEREGMYNRNFDLDAAPFSNAEYEMVILHPDHFLPAGSGIAMHTKDPADASRLVPKLYMIAGDGALREGIESTSPRFSAFSASHSRDIQHRVNPLLILFRLCQEYRELVDLTESLVEELYHPPVVKAAARFVTHSMVGGVSRSVDDDGDKGKEGQDEDKDVDMNPTDKSDVGTGAKKDRTDPPRRKGGRAGGKRTDVKYSRFGEEIPDPGPDASYEDTRDFFRYILSGRDSPLDRRDEAVLRSIGLHPEAQDSRGEAGSSASHVDPQA